MCQSDMDLPLMSEASAANVVLKEIITRHPDHLTYDELVTRLADDALGIRRDTILDLIGELQRSGLARTIENVVQPTHAALRAAEIFQA